jgi:hypothetical protein
MRWEVFRYRSVSLAKTVIQACSFNHSDISPFTINDLRLRNDREGANCVRPPNVPRSLTGHSSIAAPLLLARRRGRGRVSPAALTCWNLLRNRSIRRFAKRKIRLSTIVAFPNKSNHFNDVPDPATWLPLALKAPFWRLTETMSGTGPTHAWT